MYRAKFYFEDGTHLESSPVSEERVEQIIDALIENPAITGCSIEVYTPDIGWVVWEPE